MGLCGLLACFRPEKEPDTELKDANGAARNVEHHEPPVAPEKKGQRAHDAASQLEPQHSPHEGRRAARSLGPGGAVSADQQPSADNKRRSVGPGSKEDEASSGNSKEVLEQERLLRAVLDQHKQHTAQSSLSSPAGTARSATSEAHEKDPELARLAQSLAEAASLNSAHPLGAATLHQLRQALADARAWLVAAGSPQAATTLLQHAGPHMAATEKLLHSSGPVLSWGPEAVQAAVALLQLYAVLAQLSVVPSKDQQQQQQAGALRTAMVHLLIGRPNVLVWLLDLLNAHYFPSEEQQEKQQQQEGGHGQAPEKQVTAQQLWDLLQGLVRFAGAVGATVGSKPTKQQEAGTGSNSRSGSQAPSPLPSPSTALPKESMARIGGLLTPGLGLLSRLLRTPMGPQNAAAQLSAMQLLKQLLDAHGPALMRQQEVASHFVGLHAREMQRWYLLAGSDADSAFAELAKVHLKMLRALAASGTPAVRTAFHQQHVVEFLVREFSLEAQLLSIEEAEAAARREAEEDEEGDSDDSSSLSSSSDCGEREVQAHPSRGRPARSSTGGLGAGPSLNTLPMPAGMMAGDLAQHTKQHPHQHGKEGGGGKGAGGKFRFTYDLNEDLERLMELENQLGGSVELEGLEYDEEAKRLMQRDVLAEQAARMASEGGLEDGPEFEGGRSSGGGLLAASTGGATATPKRSPHPCAPGGMADDSATTTPRLLHRVPSTDSEMSRQGGAGGEGSSRTTIPKLLLTGLRSGTPSRIFSPAHQQAIIMAASSPGNPQSYNHGAGSNPWALSARSMNSGPSPGRPHHTHSYPESPGPGAHGPSHLAPRSPGSQEVVQRAPTLVDLPNTGSVNREEEGRAGSLAPARGRALLPPMGSSGGAGRMGAPSALPPLRGAVPPLPVSHLHHSHMSPLSSRTATSPGRTSAPNSCSARGGPADKPPLPPQAQPHSTLSISRAAAAAAGGSDGGAAGRTPAGMQSAPASSGRGRDGAHGGEQSSGGGALQAEPSSSSSTGEGQDQVPPLFMPPPRRSFQQVQIPGSARGTASAASPSAQRGDQQQQGAGGAGAPRPVPALNLLALGRPGTALNSSSRARAGAGTASNDSRYAPPTGVTIADSAMDHPHLPPSYQASPSSNSPAGRGVGTPPMPWSVGPQQQRQQQQGPNSGTARSAGQGEGAGSQAPGHGQSSSNGTTSSMRVPYVEAVAAKLWFSDPELHVLLLRLLLQLLLTPTGTLDPAHMQTFPAESGSTHVEHVLSWHFAGPPGAAILPQLSQALCASISKASKAVSPAPGAPATAAAAGKGSGSNSSSTMAAASAKLVHARAALRLLRLLSRQLFNPGRYSDLVFHSRGAYGGVYRARLADEAAASAAGLHGQQIMIKAIELPASGWDRSVLPDVFGEVSILERYALRPLPPGTAPTPASLSPDHSGLALPGPGLPGDSGPDASSITLAAQQLKQALAQLQSTAVTAGFGSAGHEGICQLLDFGLAPDAYWIVMRRYRCSLSDWRARQPTPPSKPAAAALYLAVLVQVVEVMQVLAADSVVHFDLKAANVLVEPLPGVKDSQLYGPPPPPPCEPPFRCVLADFGEARAYRSADEAFTARNRGTEVYKSPEMLLMNVAASASFGPTSPAVSAAAAAAVAGGAGGGASTPTGLRSTGAGLASDVWSFGCLAYEVLAGKVLFGDADYASVTHRVAFGAGANLKLEASEREALGCGPAGAGADGVGPQLAAFVEWVLARDPLKRPPLAAIRARLQELREEQLVLAKASA